MSHLRLYSFCLGGATVAAVSISYWVRGRRKSAEQREQERRLRLSRFGRITDGTVIDVHETADSNPIQLLIYQYDVAGVSYECSQDVTHLRQFIDLHSCRLGLPASIKYDPQNPGNSILLSEEWSGVRKAPVSRVHQEPQSAESF
jgi:hypothetical protein